MPSLASTHGVDTAQKGVFQSACCCHLEGTSPKLRRLPLCVCVLAVRFYFCAQISGVRVIWREDFGAKTSLCIIKNRLSFIACCVVSSLKDAVNFDELLGNLETTTKHISPFPSLPPCLNHLFS